MADLSIHPTTGHVVAGVGSGTISINNVPLAHGLPGGTPDWVSADTVGYNGTPDGHTWHLWQNTPPSGTPVLLGDGATTFYAGGGVWAGYVPGRGVFDSKGRLYGVSTALLGVGSDGAVYYCPQAYADGAYGIRARYPDSTDVEVLPTSQATSRSPVRGVVGARAAIWSGYDGLCRTWNAPAPQTIPGQPVYSPSLVSVSGVLWLVYVAGNRGVAHPLADPRYGYYLGDVDKGFYLHAVPWNGGILAAWSTTQGAQPGQIRTQFVDTTEIRVPLFPPEPQPVLPLNRACWVGFFNTRQHAPTPGNCEIWTLDLMLRDRAGHVIAQYVAGEPETDLASLNAKIAAAKQANPDIPVLAYWPRGLWSPSLLPTGADWLGIDGTQPVGMTDMSLDASIRAQFRRHPKPVLIGQCYTNLTPGLTQELTHLVPIYSEILHDYPNAPAIVAFSGYDRATGYNDHPEVHALWTDWFATAHTPTPPTPEPPMPTTRTAGFLTWIKKFITNEKGGDDVGTVVANDRYDADGKLVPQQVFAWQEMFIVPRGNGRVTINGVSGRFWAAERANTTTFMDPTAVITCKRTAPNLNDDSWELFYLIDNGDGSVSFKSLFGFYVCCEADGRIVCNRTAIGEYEKFVLLPPGSTVPAPPAPGGPLPRIVSEPNTPIFRTEDGAPWRLKGVTNFKAAEVWNSGGDNALFVNAYPGYNTDRVFAYTEGPNWVDAPWNSPTPQQCVAFVRRMNALGRYVWWVLLTSSNPARRAAALDQIAAFKDAANLRLFLQGANEPERQHDGILIETSFMHDALASSGYPWDNGYQDNSALHRGTFVDAHTKRDGEWPRRSHDAMDIYSPPNDAPAGSVALKKQIVLGEPAKIEDVGGENVVDWKGYFGSGAFFGAGVVFHSQTGKFSQLPTDAERRMAAAALQGLNAFPADATLGAYSRIDGDGLRTYIKGDCMTRIRPNSPTPPQPGWTTLETDHVLYKR